MNRKRCRVNFHNHLPFKKGKREGKKEQAHTEESGRPAVQPWVCKRAGAWCLYEPELRDPCRQR